MDWALLFMVSMLFWGCGVVALITYLFSRD